MNTTRSFILAVVFLFSGVGFSTFASAALIARNLDTNNTTAEAYYDTALGITWLKDANVNGLMTWTNANAWAAGLTLGGYTNWRLPNTVDTGSIGCNFAYNGTDCGYNVNTATGEMASMFYNTLGNLAYYNTVGGIQPGSGLTNTGPFSGVQADYYWSATAFPVNISSTAWDFDFWYGGQAFGSKETPKYSWAVHDGNIGTAVVPVPAAAWLLGSGLLGLVGVARRKG